MRSEVVVAWRVRRGQREKAVSQGKERHQPMDAMTHTLILRLNHRNFKNVLSVLLFIYVFF